MVWGDDLEKEKGREEREVMVLGFREKIRNWVYRVCLSFFGGDNIEGEGEEEKKLNPSKRGRKRREEKNMSFSLLYMGGQEKILTS